LTQIKRLLRSAVQKFRAWTVTLITLHYNIHTIDDNKVVGDRAQNIILFFSQLVKHTLHKIFYLGALLTNWL